jgi:ankyrin repeat protein
LPSDAVAHHVSCSYDLNVLLKNYGTLESLLREAEALPDDIYSSVGELGLFVRDFLLDVSIWNSFGLELLYELGILSASHWQDMQSWTAARSLDDLEDILSSESETGNHEIDIDSTPSPNFCHLDTNKQLCYAAKAGNHHVVHGLLAFKEGPVDLSCLIAALNAGHFDIFWTLFNHGVIDEVRHDMPELICTAARCGHLATVRALVQRTHLDRTYKIFRNQYVPRHFTLALKEAAGAGHIGIVNYFLSLGEDVDGCSLLTSPLTSAAKNSHLAMVQHLVKIGAKPDGAALLAAVKQHDTSIAEYLLEHGADANSFERFFGRGRTALTIAIIENDYRMFQLLLRHGANVNAGNCLHLRPIFAAVQRNNSEFTMPLLLQGATITKSERLELIKSAEPEYQQSLLNFECSFGGYFECVFGCNDIVAMKLGTRFNASTELGTNSQMEEPRRCPVLAEIRAKERRAMKQRLRESFLRSHRKFLDRSRQPHASDALAVFANGISLPQSAWKSGINSIRRLLNSRLPSTLLEVFSSIQVSCAMRCALEGTEPPDIVHGKTNISADLDRWRLVVPADEQPLFDEIASALWDESYQTVSHQVDWRYEQEPLEYFQKLMTSLITATQASYIAGDGFDLGGERLNTIQERFSILNQVPCESHDTASLSTIYSFEEPDDLRSRQIPLLDKWKPASPMVILLTATAFFMIVVAFLSGSSTVPTTHFGKRHAKLRW